MQTFIEETTGYYLEIVSDKRTLNLATLNFSVGETDIKNDAATESADKADSFVREINGGICFIFGDSGRGTLYGVYDFIEDVLGVKFVSSDVTVVPSGVTLRLNEEDSASETPAFSVRSIWTKETQSDPLFAARRRITAPFYNDNLAASYGGGMRDIFYNDGHNVNKLYQEGYFATYGNRPDGTIIYEGGADNDGKPFFLRSTVSSDPPYSGSICLSDDKVVSLVTKGVIERIKKHPSCDYFGVMREDTKFFCSCPKCRAKSRITDVVIGFCNKIAKEVKRWSENEGAKYVGEKKKYIVTYAYDYMEIPPTLSVEDNIIVSLALINSANYAYSFTDKNQTESNIILRQTSRSILLRNFYSNAPKN